VFGIIAGPAVHTIGIVNEDKHDLQRGFHDLGTFLFPSLVGKKSPCRRMSTLEAERIRKVVSTIKYPAPLQGRKAGDKINQSSSIADANIVVTFSLCCVMFTSLSFTIATAALNLLSMDRCPEAGGGAGAGIGGFTAPVMGVEVEV
jgi:hypothetical protein